MVVDPGAEEGELGPRVDVAGRKLLEVTHQLGLGERRFEVELPAEANALRDLLEQLLDRADTDRGEHLRAVGLGQREERHLLLFQDGPVGLGVEQRVQLGWIAHPDADEPTLAVRVVVHRLRSVHDLLVDLEHLA